MGEFIATPFAPPFLAGGHPFASPYHNGSGIDVAVLVSAFSQLGFHCVTVVMCALYVVIPAYLVALEAQSIRRGNPVGHAFLALLSEVSHFALAPLQQPQRVEHATSPPPPPPPQHGTTLDPDRWRIHRRNDAAARTPGERKERALTPPLLTKTAAHGVKHLAVIMDGNRRYGKEKLGSSLRGHEAGGTALLRFIVWCSDRGIPLLTVYAFSTENWNRSAVEIAVLMGLFRSFFERIRSEARQNGIRIRYLVSDAARLPVDIVDLMRAVERETAANNRIVVNVCVSYSGRCSLVRATERLHDAGARPTDDNIRRELTRSLIDDRPCPLREADCAVPMEDGSCLDLAADPDALLRTSREQRVSNFMLYELAYTEMFFVDELWPDVKEATIDAVLDTFADARQRRFGR
jgi:undecaprenyl diphosphate synthase